MESPGEVPREQVSAMLDRRFITGDRMTLAPVHLKQGCVVARHQDENEQLTYVLEDTLGGDVFSPPRYEWVNQTGS